MLWMKKKELKEVTDNAVPIIQRPKSTNPWMSKDSGGRYLHVHCDNTSGGLISAIDAYGPSTDFATTCDVMFASRERGRIDWRNK